MNNLTFQQEGHEYYYEGKKVPCVSDIIQHFGISNFSFVNPEVLEAAREFGTNVHSTCELHDRNDLAECDPLIEPYLDQWIRFKDNEGIDSFDLIEEPLYSKVWGFAGTPDRVCGDTDVEIKTGAKTVANKIQSALYKILIDENCKVKIKNRWVVHLKPDTYTFVWYRDKTDLNIAKSLISIYNWKKENKLL